MLIDFVLKHRIYALFNTADAESLLSSFQKMLRGVCDGEVLLDNHMNIAQESECLKHLILTTVTLKGRSFQQLIAQEEHPRFSEFIDSSTEAFKKPQSKHSPPPLCLRVSFRGSAGIRVAADIYHVPVPGLLGAEEPYHLIAFKEDPESRPQPEAEEDAVPAQLLGRHVTVPEPADERSSNISKSTGQSSQDRVHLPELQEAFLLVDVDTELQDVRQIELNFRPHRLDRASGLTSSRPCLRNWVRPTDWEKLRSSVARFAEKASRDEVRPKLLKRLTLRLPGQSAWLVAEEATLHRNEAAWKVWLHLQGFVPATVRRRQAEPPSLCGIQEARLGRETQTIGRR